jgi:chromosome segregation protein
VLKLKKLQILGFKSFCDRTELRFQGDGIAAIVGPNGCGKSNIADAICWVLGEQSAKTLRGSRMEDVIFAGTPARKATGMAEVSLTLVDPERYEGRLDPGPELEIMDELPEEDWDEQALRTAADEEGAQYIEEVQPRRAEAVALPVAAAGAAGDSQHEAAAATAPEASAVDSNSTPEGIAETPSPQPDASASAEPAEGQHDPIASVAAESATAGGPDHVVLKIRRRKLRLAPLKKGEIVVTRRLFRSGESEYLLNHKLCRLRDIQEIFMGTGLGPESYAIIEQGRIGQILSSKPTDRRNIIEEAAGVTKFKTKKRLAEARLEDAKLNLNRVNDIFEEVTRQMNSLKRQAAKAARYVRLRDELRARLRVVLSSKFVLLERETAGRQAELESIGEQMRLQGEAVRQMEAEHSDGTQRGYAVESASRENRERLAEIARDADRAVSRQKQNEERFLELDERAAAAQQDLAQTAGKLQSLQAERDANRQVLDSAEAGVASAAGELTARQQEAAAAAAALTAVDKQQEMRRVSILEAANAAAGVRNRITQAEEHMAALERETQRLTKEIDAANRQLEAFGGEHSQLARECDSSTQRVEVLAGRIEESRRQLGAKRQAETDAKLRLDGLRGEHASALGKKSSLEAVIAEHGYSTDSVRRLLKSDALHGSFAPVGVLADFLEVDTRYENVVEDFLRDELNYVVVKSWDAADRGLQLLRSGVDGRATFLVHPSDSQAKFSFAVDETQHRLPRHDGAVPLKNCIRVMNGFGKSLEVVLPKLRDGYIVANPEVGRELALSNPDAFFLSQTGECFHNVTVTGGKPAAAGPLSMKRELRNVLRQLADLEGSLAQEETRAQALGREIEDLTSLLQNLEDERREAEKQAMTSGHALRQLDSETARVRERLGIYENELQRTGGERAAKEAYAAEQRHELAQREHMRQELEQAMGAAQERLGEMRTARDAAEQSASQARANLAVLEERRRAALQAVERIESLAGEVAGRVQALQAQIASAAEEKEQRGAENRQLAERLVELAKEREACQSRESALRAEAEQLRARLQELEGGLHEARAALDAARDHRGEVAAALAKLESDAGYLAETCGHDLGLTREQLRAEDAVVPVEGAALAAEDAACRELRAKIDNLGPVNMMALEEYNEVEQRHSFLETQRRDLLDSIANTQDTIREIEVITRQKFAEAFAVINANFQATFRKLFGGGQAFMRLTDEENTAESGIDVVASPPGKRLQNVLLLSGGEKALTALALLVGIFQYQPSPFCILDEVDAPLDEANVGRFTGLVREMSLRTQFVLITHTKRTMSVAPVMYGITMQEPGVSKLVSVRFNEPSAQAAD